MKGKIFTLTASLALLFLVVSCADHKDALPPVTEDFCAKVHRNDSVSLSEQFALVKDSAEIKTGVYVLESGDRSMIARAWLCEYAEKSLDIQYFIFSTDNVGLIACDYLVRAADRGVKVRILVDDIMVEAGTHEILTMDSHENIEIKIYNPGANTGKNILKKIDAFVTFFDKSNRRMHNKTFIADGKAVITGGRNVADEYFDYDREYNFRDRDVLLVGKEVNAVNTSFEEFWSSALSVPVTNVVNEPGADFSAKDRFDRLHNYACNPENFWPGVRYKIDSLHNAIPALLASEEFVWIDSVKFVSDAPGKNLDRKERTGGNTTDELIKLVQSAKERIDIQSPYLVVTDEGIKIFKEAIAKGVKIRILTNSLASTDNVEAFSGYQRDRKELLDIGLQIFEFRPDAKSRYDLITSDLQKQISYTPVYALHAKTMVIDGRITVIGTFNLDPRSANLNSECITIINSEKVARSVGTWMEKEFSSENAWEITHDFNPDKEAGKYKRLKTWSRQVVPKEIL